MQARDDITDGADNKQIDAIFVDDDEATAFVIQGKFIGRATVEQNRYAKYCQPGFKCAVSFVFKKSRTTS